MFFVLFLIVSLLLIQSSLAVQVYVGGASNQFQLSDYAGQWPDTAGYASGYHLHPCGWNFLNSQQRQSIVSQFKYKGVVYEMDMCNGVQVPQVLPTLPGFGFSGGYITMDISDYAQCQDAGQSNLRQAVADLGDGFGCLTTVEPGQLCTRGCFDNGVANSIGYCPTGANLDVPVEDVNPNGNIIGSCAEQWWGVARSKGVGLSWIVSTYQPSNFTYATMDALTQLDNEGNSPSLIDFDNYQGADCRGGVNGALPMAPEGQQHTMTNSAATILGIVGRNPKYVRQHLGTAVDSIPQIELLRKASLQVQDVLSLNNSSVVEFKLSQLARGEESEKHVLTVSNAADHPYNFSPLLHAELTGNNYQVKFECDGKDITERITSERGFPFVADFRIKQGKHKEISLLFSKTSSSSSPSSPEEEEGFSVHVKLFPYVTHTEYTLAEYKFST